MGPEDHSGISLELCREAGPEREQLRPQVERPAKPDRQLEGHARKGILQLPPCVKTHGQRGHGDLIQHVIVIVLRAMVQAPERRQAVHARDVNIPAISVKRGHSCFCGIHGASKLPNHLRTVRSNAGRFTTLRE